MATGTHAATTAGNPRDSRILIALGVLLVAFGIGAGLIIGGIARQDESFVGASPAATVQVGRLDDYALRHAQPTHVADPVTRLGRLDDYANRHPQTP